MLQIMSCERRYRKRSIIELRNAGLAARHKRANDIQNIHRNISITTMKYSGGRLISESAGVVLSIHLRDHLGWRIWAWAGHWIKRTEDGDGWAMTQKTP